MDRPIASRCRKPPHHSSSPRSREPPSNFFFSRTLQLHCKFRYSHEMLSIVCRRLSSVCLCDASVAYCDKTAGARIMQFSPKRSPMPYLFQYTLPAKFDYEIRNSAGSKWSGVVFDRVRDAISERVRDRA